MSGWDATVIPTYKRGDTINGNTLAMLEAYGVDPGMIHVFIGSDPGEYDLPDGVHQHEAPAGYKNAQNLIWRTFPAGHRMLHLDDDVISIQTIEGKHKLRDVTAEEFQHTMARAFRFLKATRTSLFGLSTSSNPFYMNPKWRTGAYFVNGQCFGYINNPELALEEDCKEDCEITFIHFQQSGALGRIGDHYANTHPMRVYPGGMQAEPGRSEREDAARDSLLKRFPGIAGTKKGRNRHHDLTIKGSL